MLKKFNVSVKQLYLLMFITAASLIGLGLYGISNYKKLNEDTGTLYTDRVVCMRQLANIRFEYTAEIVPAAMDVKKHLLTFAEALQRVGIARVRIDSNWNNYKLTYLTPEEALLAKQTGILKGIVDADAKILESILLKKDTVAITDLAKKQLSATEKPFNIKLTQLMDLQERVAKQIYQSSNHTSAAASNNFALWLFFSLLIVLVMSYYIIKNIKRLIRDILTSHDVITLSEHRYRSILENASDAIYIADNIGNFIDLSESMCEMLGYSKDELMLLSFSDIVDPENLKTNPVERPANPDQPIFKERIFITKDGRKLAIEINEQRLSEDSLMGIARNVTERKKIETELRETEMKFRTLVEKSIVGVYITTGKRFLYINPRFAEIFGYKPQELIELADEVMGKLFAKESLDIIDVNIKARYNGETESANYELAGIRKDGTINYIEVYGNIVTIGGESAIIGTVLDITERKHTEELILKDRSVLIESENRFRRAFEDSAIGMGLTSIEKGSLGRWLKVNRSLCEMLGYTEDELLSRSFMQITHPEDLTADLAAQSRILQGESDTYRLEKRYIHKNGNFIWINLNVSIVRDNDKQPVYLLAQIENITEKIESQRKFQNLVEDSTVGVYILQNEQLVYVNPRIIEETGYSEEEIIGMPYEGFIYSDDLELVKKMIDSREKGQVDTIRYEARIIKKDGNPLWYEIIGSKTVYGSAPALIGTMVDITERKAAEKEIHRLTRLYQFISSINESILKAGDIDQVYTDACRIAVEVGGFKMAWIGTYDKKNDRVTPVTWSGYEDGFFAKINVAGMQISRSAIPSARAIREQSHFYYNDIVNDSDIPLDIKHEMIKRGYLSGVSFPILVDGEIVAAMVLLMSEPFFFNEGEIELLRDVTDNITYALDKIKIRELQNQSEANLKSIFESTDVCYLLLDNKYTILALNQQMRDIYREGMGIVLTEGEDVIMQIKPERREELLKLYDGVRLTKRPSGYEVTFNKSGVIKHFTASAFPIMVGDEVIGICITGIDITVRKNATEQLKQLNEDLLQQAKDLAISNVELEQFAYVASHDLQEPLRMVTSFLSQLEKKYGDVLDEKGKKYIYYATDGAKRMRQLILDLLEYSQVGRTENNVENVDFNDLMNEILPLYRRNIDELKAKVHVARLPVMLSYKTPVRQILQNLLGNALKYHREGIAPLIQISSNETPTAFEFSVKDNGIGIDPEYFNQIFIIFKRLHNRDHYPGTGMGLAITKKIVENLGGTIWVASREGEGSVFHFTLPKHTT